MDKIAFRRGFLLALASYGLGPEEFGRLVAEKQSGVKTAFNPVNLLDPFVAAGIGVPLALGTLAARHNADGDANNLYRRTRIKYNPINDVSNELAQATRRLQTLKDRRQPKPELPRVTSPALGSESYLQPLPPAR